MSSDASIAQGNREIAGSKTFQNDACIDDRTVALGPLQRVAERLRGSGNVVEQPDKPEVRVARQSEAEEWIVQCFGGKLQKPDLARNADAHVFVVYLNGRQTGASQQRLENNARLAQASRSQTRRHAHRVRLQVKVSHVSQMPGLCSVSHREVGTGPAHRNDSRARQARANQWQQITKHLSPQLNRIVQSVACPARQSPLPAFALDPGRYVSIKQDKKCAEPASGPRACSATKKRFG